MLAFVSGLLRDGYELISQAHAQFSSVCGVLHEDVCTCLRLLGRLSYILGDYSEVNAHRSSIALTTAVACIKKKK